MSSYIPRRLLQAIPTVLGITIVVFMLIKLAPGDPLTVLEESARGASPEAMAALRQQYGLDQPLPLQYLAWLGRVARGDLGRSFQHHEPVFDMILERVPATLQLGVGALLFGLGLGIPMGVAAAVRRGSWIDAIVRVLAVVGEAVPHFWLGLMAIVFFSVELRILPSGGITTLGSGGDLFDRIWHLILPVTITGTGFLATFSRFMRTEMLEVISQDYVRTARAKGLRQTSVVFRHAMRNALIPVATILGGSLPGLFSGVALTEFVFSWPGMGRMALDAAFTRDYTLTMGVLVFVSVLIVLGSLLSDFLYSLVDPRIRLA